VFVFFALNGIPMFFLALAVGSIVGAVAVVIAKSIGLTKADAVPEDAVDELHVHASGATAASPRPVNA
jgi:PTS system fructose-specific IIC component